MADYPATFLEKKLSAYDDIFNAVASESPSTPNHELRLATAKALVQNASQWDAFITRDLLKQRLDEASRSEDYTNRISALLTNIVVSGG